MMMDVKVFNHLFHLMQENKDNLLCLKEVHDLSLLSDQEEFNTQYHIVMNKYSEEKSDTMTLKNYIEHMLENNPEVFNELGKMLFQKPSLSSLLTFCTYYMMWEQVELDSGKQKVLK